MEMGLLLRRPDRQVSMKQEVKKLKAGNVQILLIGLTPNILFFAMLTAWLYGWLCGSVTQPNTFGLAEMSQ